MKEKPKLFSNEVIKKANDAIKKDTENNKSIILGFSNTRELEGMKIMRENWVKEEIRKEENNANLKIIAQNTKEILEQFSEQIITLKSIDSLLQRNGLNFSEVLSEIREQKHINADVYSVLVKSQIDTEESRVEASKNLGSLLDKGINVSANLLSILHEIVSRTS